MTEPGLAPDTAIVLGLASTAMPFARSPEAEAERWLRILRVHGEAGVALSGLGVTEAPLQSPDQGGDRAAARGDAAVARVTEHAGQIATGRGAGTVDTTDVLLAVMHVYGGDFDRVLRAHGTDRDEVLARLAGEAPAGP